MLAFVLRRLLQSLLVMAVVAFIAFAPVQLRRRPDRVHARAGRDDPGARSGCAPSSGSTSRSTCSSRTFLGNAVQGDFGVSLRQGRQVAVLLKERLPATLELSFAAALIALFVGIPLGVYTALRRHTWLVACPARRLAASACSLPTFLIGILLILVFAVYLGWLPSLRPRRRRAARLVDDRPADAERAQGADPARRSRSSLFQLTLIMRLVRAEMLEVLRTDYIKFARARGLTDRVDPLRPCAEEHAGAGDHDHRPAARRDHRVRDHHRDGVPVAGHGAAVHPGGARSPTSR